MAIVYRANDQLLSREVALKVLNKNLARDEAALQRFRNEAMACSALNHPNIVKILASGVDETLQQPFIVMELLQGKNLESIFKDESRFNVDRFAQVFIPVLDALSYAHNNKIIHRDLKPANIISSLDESNQECFKIVDFGIAKILETGEVSQDVTVGLLGSPLYMSPEQCLGAKADARSDIYSLACVMYEALIGNPPFEGGNALETMYEHLRKTIPKMLEISASMQIPRALVEVVLLALSKEPEKRPQSAADLKREVEKAIAEGFNVSRRKTNVLWLVVPVALVAGFVLLKGQPHAVPYLNNVEKSSNVGKTHLVKRINVGKSLMEEAGILRGEGKNKEALEKYQEAIEAFRKQRAKLGEPKLDAESFVVNDKFRDDIDFCFTSCSIIHSEQQKYDESVREMEQCMKLYSHARDAGRMRAAKRLAGIYAVQQLFPKAEETYRTNLAAAAAEFKDDVSEDLASFNCDFASLFLIERKYEDALVYSQKAMDVLDRMRTRRTTATAIHNTEILYNIFMGLGKPQQADEALEKTKSALVNSYNTVAGIFPTGNLDHTGSVAEFGNVALNCKHYALAREMYNLALQNIHRIKPDDAARIAKACRDGLAAVDSLEKSSK